MTRAGALLLSLKRLDIARRTHRDSDVAGGVEPLRLPRLYRLCKAVEQLDRVWRCLDNPPVFCFQEVVCDSAIEQRQLVELFFRHTPVNRVEAHTDVDNVAEQRALEKVGMTREGTTRGAQWRNGAFRDGYSYSVLRAEWGA